MLKTPLSILYTLNPEWVGGQHCHVFYPTYIIFTNICSNYASQQDMKALALPLFTSKPFTLTPKPKTSNFKPLYPKP